MPGRKKEGKGIEPVSFGRGFMQEIMHNSGAPREQRQSFKVKCAECGKETDVPFKPLPNRPVYCRECYAKKKQSR